MTQHPKSKEGLLFKPVRLWDADGSFFPKRHRRAFVASRGALSDSDFVAKCHAPDETKRLVLVVRHAIGNMCRIAAEHIHPDVTPGELIPMMLEWDDVEFMMQVEQLLGCEIPDSTKLPTFTGWRCFRTGEDGASNLGEWAIRVAQRLTEIDSVQRSGSVDA